MRIKILNNFICNVVSISLFVIGVILSYSAYSGDRQANDEFLNELFSPVELVKYGKVLPRQYSQLTELDKKNLLNAKFVLVEFLKSFHQKDQDPLEYLNSALRSKYTDRVKLYRAEFGAESLLEIEIFNFIIKGQNKDEIVFYAALTETTEGEDRIIQTAFALKKTGDTWKISRFGKDIKYWEIELSQQGKHPGRP